MALRFILVATTCLLGAMPMGAISSPATQDAQQLFMSKLRTLCGKRFAGTASIVPPDGKAVWEGAPIIASVASCTAAEVRVPVQVGTDRSRTWLFRMTPEGLTLAHDHRHADGSADEQTMYGGPASKDGSALVQRFSADAYTASLLPASAVNVWQVTLAPDGSMLTYYLERKGVPRLKAELRRQP